MNSSAGWGDSSQSIGALVVVVWQKSMWSNAALAWTSPSWICTVGKNSLVGSGRE